MALDYFDYLEAHEWDEYVREKHLYEWEQIGDLIEGGIGLVGAGSRGELDEETIRNAVGDIWTDLGEYQFGFESYNPYGDRGETTTAPARSSGSGLLLLGALLLGFFLLKG